MLDQYPIISDQISRPALNVVLQQLDHILRGNVKGDIVELGCYIGTTSLFIRRLLDSKGQSDGRQFHVYDSFEGLPPKSEQDQSTVGEAFRAGELQVSKKQLISQFKKTGLRPPVIHKEWFDDLRADDLPQQIAFAFLDGDFYDSILTSLQLVWPRLSPGAIVCIDDYQRQHLPGVERAVHQFFQGRRQPDAISHGIAVIRN